MGQIAPTDLLKTLWHLYSEILYYCLQIVYFENKNSSKTYTCIFMLCNILIDCPCICTLLYIRVNCAEICAVCNGWSCRPTTQCTFPCSVQDVVLLDLYIMYCKHYQKPINITVICFFIESIHYAIITHLKFVKRQIMSGKIAFSCFTFRVQMLVCHDLTITGNQHHYCVSSVIGQETSYIHSY